MPGLIDAKSRSSRHVGRMRRAMGAALEEAVVAIGIDVMCLHHPHQMHRIDGVGKATIDVADIVADRLGGAGEPFGADTDDAGAMLLV